MFVRRVWHGCQGVKVALTRFRLRMAWHGMVEVCEGAPVAVSGWVLADRHDRRPCAASSLHRGTISVTTRSNIMKGIFANLQNGVGN